MDSSFPSTLVSSRADYRVQAGPTGLASIHVRIEPFEFGGEAVQGPIRLDVIDIDLSDLPTLAGRRFVFPVCPEAGYIDGSLYVLTRHLSYDVTVLDFGALRGNALALSITGVIRLSEQSSVEDATDGPLTVQTWLELPLDDDAIAALATAAIQSTGAVSTRESGKVMAHLALRYRDSPYMERLSRAVARQLEAR